MAVSRNARDSGILKAAEVGGHRLPNRSKGRDSPRSFEAIRAPCAATPPSLRSSKEEVLVSEGRRLHPQLSLHDLDATDLGGLGRLDKECGPFTVIFIDVGGGSVQSVAKLWALIESYTAVLSPRLFVVKSFKLAELLQRCQAGAAVT